MSSIKHNTPETHLGREGKGGTGQDGSSSRTAPKMTTKCPQSAFESFLVGSGDSRDRMELPPLVNVFQFGVSETALNHSSKADDL